MHTKANAPAIYLGSGNPALKNYYPKWIDNLAPDVTLEGSLLDGAVQGAEAVRSILGAIRSLYEAPGAQIRRPLHGQQFPRGLRRSGPRRAHRCVVLVTGNAAGQTQNIVASYRPRSSLLLLSGLMHEKLAGAPLS
jgi:hypothetical protein